LRQRPRLSHTFPAAGRSERRHDTGDDHSKFFSRCQRTAKMLGLPYCVAGEALSAVLLEGTLAGLASRTLTRMTEAPLSRHARLGPIYS
jgi:hypothetical protein